MNVRCHVTAADNLLAWLSAKVSPWAPAHKPTWNAG